MPGAFADRREAGASLADALARFAPERPVVLGIPRGGVAVAAEVARSLDAPLDVVIPRKVGAPGNPELGLGAVAPGVRVLDERLTHDLGVSREYLEREIEAQEREIERRSAAYRGDRYVLLEKAVQDAMRLDSIWTMHATAVAAKNAIVRSLRLRYPNAPLTSVGATTVTAPGQTVRVQVHGTRVVLVYAPTVGLAVQLAQAAVS